MAHFFYKEVWRIFRSSLTRIFPDCSPSTTFTVRVDSSFGVILGEAQKKSGMTTCTLTSIIWGRLRGWSTKEARGYYLSNTPFLYQFKTFCFNLSVFGLTRNVPLCLRQFLDQIKLFCFVPKFLGRNRKDLQLKRLILHHIRTFWFDLLLFGLNRNIPLCLRQFLDQNKLFFFVPESLGQNGNDPTLKKKL